MAPPAAPTALHHRTPLLLPLRAAAPGATATATARAARAASLAVRAAQPDTTAAASASASTSAPEPPAPVEFKPPPGFKVPEPKRFEVKPGQQNSVLGASLAIPLRLGTGVFVLGYAPYCAFSDHPRVYLAYGLHPTPAYLHVSLHCAGTRHHLFLHQRYHQTNMHWNSEVNLFTFLSFLAITW